MVSGSYFGVRVFGFEFWSIGFKFWGLGFRSWGLELKFWGLGLRFWEFTLLAYWVGSTIYMLKIIYVCMYIYLPFTIILN